MYVCALNNATFQHIYLYIYTMNHSDKGSRNEKKFSWLRFLNKIFMRQFFSDA